MATVKSITWSKLAVTALAAGSTYYLRSVLGYFGLQAWESAIVFGILIVILVFRPTGLLGSAAKEKV